MMRVVGAALGGLLVLLAFATQPSATAQPAESGIVDRTLSCSVAVRAGVRAVEVQANAGTRLFEDRSKWKYLAGASVGDSEAGLASISAGNPKAPEDGFVFPLERLSIAVAPKCRAATRIPLSKSGLSGGPASQLFDRYECFPGGRVLVRVRGVFRAPTSLKLKTYPDRRRLLVAIGTVTQGFLAVSSQGGKPLAYAEMFEPGKARLFTARSCVAA